MTKKKLPPPPPEPEYKSWSEIKLRNPDKRTCNALEQIMNEMYEKSATKAIERLIHNYAQDKAAKSDLVSTIQKLREEKNREKERAEEAEFKLLQIKASYSQFISLIADVPALPTEKVADDLNFYPTSDPDQQDWSEEEDEIVDEDYLDDY